MEKEYSDLNVSGVGIATGLIYAICLFFCALWAMCLGHSESMGIFSIVYPGYEASIMGSIGGLLYGLIDGFLVGVIFAWIYNKVK